MCCCGICAADGSVWLVVVVLVASVLGPGFEASPIRVARSPYLALRCCSVGCRVLCANRGVLGIWYGLWSPSSAVKLVDGCCPPCCCCCC